MNTAYIKRALTLISLLMLFSVNLSAAQIEDPGASQKDADASQATR
jgi:hypothetical protein